MLFFTPNTIKNTFNHKIESIVETNSLDCLNYKEDSEEKLTLTELKEKAKELKIKGYTKMSKEELEEAIKENK